MSGLTVEWNTRGKVRSSRVRPRHADVLDVSITGARLVAPQKPSVAVGQTITIAAGGSRGTVTVRHIELLSHAHLAAYGVEFLRLEPGLEAFLFSQIATDRPEGLELKWGKAL